MPKAIRLDDKDDASTPHTVTGAASKVTIVGKAAARKGDLLTGGFSVTSGSPKVFIEDKAAARAGDPASNGSATFHLVASQTKVVIN